MQAWKAERNNKCAVALHNNCTMKEKRVPSPLVARTRSTRDPIHKRLFQDARTKLKTSEAMDQPITCSSFSSNGQIFAYAVSYDWSRGHEFYQPQKKNQIFLRPCYDELKPRTKS